MGLYGPQCRPADGKRCCLREIALMDILINARDERTLVPSVACNVTGFGRLECLNGRPYNTVNFQTVTGIDDERYNGQPHLLSDLNRGGNIRAVGGAGFASAISVNKVHLVDTVRNHQVVEHPATRRAVLSNVAAHHLLSDAPVKFAACNQFISNHDPLRVGF